MQSSTFLRLLVLSAIWGASFLFVKIGAPVLGPVALITCRVVLASLFLLAVARVLNKQVQLQGRSLHFLIFGGLGTALPFLLFAFAAQTVSASLLSILNATSPMWASAFAALWTRQAPAFKTLLGLGLGLLGVMILAGVESLHLPQGGGLAILAGLSAAASYGLATVYANQAPAVEPFENALGSVLAASILILPLVVWTFASDSPNAANMAHGSWPSLSVILCVLALGVLCSGVAYLLYFKLLAEVGPAPALTVTYLIPVFGILWGVIFLHETVGWHTLLGSVTILLGTALVMNFKPSFKAKEQILQGRQS